MRLPALIIASAGSGYQTLYRSKAFGSLNPRDLDAVCRRMDSYRFDGACTYFITQSLGKMVIGKSTLISKPEYGDRKIKVTHCYFMNMNSFVDIVRGFRRQGAVIATFKDRVRQDYDETVENVTFIRRPFAESTMPVEDIIDAVVSWCVTDQNKKFMFSDIKPSEAMKVLFGYLPSSFISDLSILTNGEAQTNDMNVLFGRMNVISDNHVLSIHAASRGITNIGQEINTFVTSPVKNYIVEIMEHVDRLEMGFLAELISVTRIITDFENKGTMNAENVIRLMDKASTIEGKMSVYGIVIELKNAMKDAKVSGIELLEKYWAFVLFTSVANGDRKNAALVNNVCANQKGFNRERYLNYVKEAILLKYEETDDDDLALLILLAHERAVDKTRLINNRYDIRLAKAFAAKKLNLGSRRQKIEQIMMENVLS